MAAPVCANIIVTENEARLIDLLRQFGNETPNGSIIIDFAGAGICNVRQYFKPKSLAWAEKNRAGDPGRKGA